MDKNYFTSDICCDKIWLFDVKLNIIPFLFKEAIPDAFIK